MPQALDTTILFIPHASHAGEPHSIDKEGQPACELHSRTEVWPAALYTHPMCWEEDCQGLRGFRNSYPAAQTPLACSSVLNKGPADWGREWERRGGSGWGAGARELEPPVPEQLGWDWLLRCRSPPGRAPGKIHLSSYCSQSLRLLGGFRSLSQILQLTNTTAACHVPHNMQ